MRESCQVTGKKEQGNQMEIQKKHGVDLKPDKMGK
jgi:hypothetical protein